MFCAYVLIIISTDLLPSPGTHHMEDVTIGKHDVLSPVEN